MDLSLPLTIAAAIIAVGATLYFAGPKAAAVVGALGAVLAGALKLRQDGAKDALEKRDAQDAKNTAARHEATGRAQGAADSVRTELTANPDRVREHDEFERPS